MIYPVSTKQPSAHNGMDLPMPSGLVSEYQDSYHRIEDVALQTKGSAKESLLIFSSLTRF